jgi:hypothetical protein
MGGSDRSRKDLLSEQRLVDCTREAPTPWPGLAPALALLLACQRAFLVAQLPQAGAQCPQRVCVMLIDCGMVGSLHELMLLAAKKTALEPAGHGHLRTTFVTTDRR